MRLCKKCKKVLSAKTYCGYCRKSYMESYRMDTWYEESRAKYIQTGVWVINDGRSNAT